MIFEMIFIINNIEAGRVLIQSKTQSLRSSLIRILTFLHRIFNPDNTLKLSVLDFISVFHACL